jgi:KDO2-lipid IV(A) lauroyltransferase
MKKALVYFGYATAWQLIKWLPEKSAYKLGDWLADKTYKKNGRGVQRLRKNYARITKRVDVEDLVKAGMRSYLRYWIDTFRFPNWDKERIVSTVVCQGEAKLRNPISQGRGVIVAIPHAGNWDHAAAYFCSTNLPLTTVAEHLEPENYLESF